MVKSLFLASVLKDIVFISEHERIAIELLYLVNIGLVFLASALAHRDNLKFSVCKEYPADNLCKRN